MDRPLHIAVIGRQGSGKGTQAELLAERLGLSHLSTGDLLRDEAAASGPTAEVVRGYLEAGALVPDALVDALVARAIRAARTGTVLDGYPRTAAQVSMLDRLVDLDLVVELDLPPSEAMRRLLARGRHDDDPVTARRRLDAYEHATAPLLRSYRERGLLATVDGTGSVEEVHLAILRAVIDARRHERARGRAIA